VVSGRSRRQEEGIDTPQSRFWRDQHGAMSRAWQRLRHDLATPLSGALLHVEVARRRAGRLGSDGGADVQESLSTVQAEIERSAAILELVSALGNVGAGEPAAFDPGEAVARGVRPISREIASRGLGLDLPEAVGPVAFGLAEQIERAAAALTKNAVESARGPGILKWSVARDGGSVLLELRFPGALEVGDPRHFFALNAEGRSMDRAFEMLLARCVIEGHGGQLTISQESGTVRIGGALPERVS
jgi:signal transduction histidine kinase